jgi:hypothetical protein
MVSKTNGTHCGPKSRLLFAQYHCAPKQLVPFPPARWDIINSLALTIPLWDAPVDQAAQLSVMGAHFLTRIDAYALSQ